jgi:hypothetical protein
VIHGTLGLGSAAVGQGEQSKDVPVEVAGGTFRVVGSLAADEVTNAGYPDLDLELYDPSGNLVDSSGVPGGVEQVDVAVTVPGTYVFRVVNYVNAGGSFTLTVDKHVGAEVAAATLAPVPAEHVEADGDRVDFDGAFTLAWSGNGRETAWRIEQSRDGGPWQQVARTDGATRTLLVGNLADGEYAFRVRSEFPGAVCTYVEQAGNEERVRVERRTQVEASGVRVVVTRAALAGGVFEVDAVLRNDSGAAVLNPVRLEVVGITSPNGDVTVANADNGGIGTSAAAAAAFGYAAEVGDEVLAPGESSAARTLRFHDPSGDMFNFQYRVVGYARP